MDVGRAVLEQSEARTRLDAGTWGTMGVGLGYAIGAAVTNPGRLVVAVEGDSAFGFSGMEMEVRGRVGGCWSLGDWKVGVWRLGGWGALRRTSSMSAMKAWNAGSKCSLVTPSPSTWASSCNE